MQRYVGGVVSLSSSALRNLIVMLMMSVAMVAAPGADTLAFAAPPAPAAPASTTPPATAFFYGDHVPRELFAHYDRVVVDPDHLTELPKNTRGQPFAYVSLGEVHPTRAWRKDVPEKLIIGKNGAFGSDIVDTTSDAWKTFVLDRVIKPLHDKGYRGFFFDTLDSYQRVTQDPAQQAAHVRGLTAIVLAVKQRHPDSKILLNRGFEMIAAVASSVDGVVAESLFQSYDANQRRYQAMTPEQTAALKARLDDAKNRGLPISVIDYVPSTDKKLRIDTAKKILAFGYDPWVTGPALDEIGVGRARILPRKVLVVYRHSDEGYLGIQDACVLVAPILEYLGYIPDYVDIRKGLPQHNLAGQYAGIVMFVPEGASNEVVLRRWVTRQLDVGLKIAFLYGFGFNADAAFLSRLGLAAAPETAKAPMTITTKDSPYVGFEAPLRVKFLDRPPVKVVGTIDVKSFLHLEDADKAKWDAIMIGPWGGAAFGPYVLEEGLAGVRRWILDPFKFLEDALELPQMPVPDVTTESGRRIWTTHIDGDAFYSRSELKGNPFTATIVLKEILSKYKVPHTVSIVEGEISPEGLVMRPPPGKPYPDPTIKTEAQKKEKVETLEDIAREIFKVPHVEIASHTYSHPFFWEDAEAGKTAPHGVEPVHLQIDGYKFSIERDIKGSIDYINNKLAPPGKKVQVLLWSGSCSPSKDAVALTQKLGVQNVNGGGATRTHDLSTLTRGSAMGIPKGDGVYQVFAPVENENVYTNDFLGPFYGYRHAIDTFTLNESPRRLSILTIYYHFYSAAKQAAIIALKEVYDWALKQETTPLYLSEYAAKVISFQQASVAQRIDDPTIWQLGDLGELRTVRVPIGLGWPDMVKSSAGGVAGYRDVKQGRYITIARNSSPTVDLALSLQSPRVPFIDNANGRILTWKSEGAGHHRVKLHVAGHMPLSITVGGANGCTLKGPFGTGNMAKGGGRTITIPKPDTGEAILECH